MKIQPLLIGQAIDELVASSARPDVGAGVRGIIDLCARHVLHPDWASLRAIDYAGDVPALRAWFDRTIASEPPPMPLRGLYFAVCHPLLDAGELTADMQVVGTAAYAAADADLNWLLSRHYFPGACAGSGALHALYGAAYRTHGLDVEVEGALGNDAEWPIGLAFAVLAARAILEGRTIADLPTDADRVGVAAGWDDGDMLLIGEVTAQGFIPAGTRRT